MITNESLSYLNLSLFTTLLTNRSIPCTTQDKMSFTLDVEAYHCNELHCKKIKLTFRHRARVVGPCHHGMARPQIADRGTASNMEGSCE